MLASHAGAAAIAIALEDQAGMDRQRVALQPLTALPHSAGLTTDPCLE